MSKPYKLATTHEEWNEALKSIANHWYWKYNLDEEESYSKLLVTYAEALAEYNPEAGASFDTFFTWKKRGTLTALLREKDTRLSNTTPLDESALDYSFGKETIVPLIREIMFELDSKKLDEDTLAVLEYLRSDEFQTKEHPHNMGKYTIVNELTIKGWSYRKALRAVENLGAFYRGYAYA